MGTYRIRRTEGPKELIGNNRKHNQKDRLKWRTVVAAQHADSIKCSKLASILRVL